MWIETRSKAGAVLYLTVAAQGTRSASLQPGLRRQRGRVGDYWRR